jgi:hypothetical protein
MVLLNTYLSATTSVWAFKNYGVNLSAMWSSGVPKEQNVANQALSGCNFLLVNLFDKQLKY